jgi:homoserine kinase type II
MGIKREITLEKIKQYINVSKITATQDGVSDSVYILDDNLVLKVLEDTDTSYIDEEKRLLNILKSLSVPNIVDEFDIDDTTAIVYTKVAGDSLKSTNIDDISQIARFLKSMHTKTKGLKSSNKSLFDKENLQSLIESTNSIEIKRIYESIDIKLSNDGIIHGDLFMDNAKFKNNKLSGVYDFIEACEGDFLFDLAVVASSWCIDDTVDTLKIDTLIKSYDKNIDKKIFREYIKYALLYYATTRYIANRDYKELLNKIKLLEDMYE